MEAHFHLSNEQQSADSETHCSVDSEGNPRQGVTGAGLENFLLDVTQPAQFTVSY